MAMSALALARTNKQFLLGRAVDEELQNRIATIILSRPSVEGLFGAKSRWESPECFAYRCELDFKGSFFAEMLKSRYAGDQKADLDAYAEDVTRAMEMEVFQIQKAIRKEVPHCKYIELGAHSVEKRLYSSEEKSVATAKQ